MRLLSIENLAVGWGGRKILGAVNLEVMEGDLCRIVGENGSGKSTLLKTILGILEPLEGRVSWCVERDQVGYVPQVFPEMYHLPMTLAEAVSLGAPLRGLDGTKLRRRVDQEIEFMGLGSMADRDMRELSGGQKRRMLLARAFVRRPKLLVADEPSAGLDQTTKDQWEAMLTGEIRNRSMSLIWVTHEAGSLKATKTLACNGGLCQATP